MSSSEFFGADDLDTVFDDFFGDLAPFLGDLLNLFGDFLGDFFGDFSTGVFSDAGGWFSCLRFLDGDGRSSSKQFSMTG